MLSWQHSSTRFPPPLHTTASSSNNNLNSLPPLCNGKGDSLRFTEWVVLVSSAVSEVLYGAKLIKVDLQIACRASSVNFLPEGEPGLATRCRQGGRALTRWNGCQPSPVRRASSFYVFVSRLDRHLGGKPIVPITKDVLFKK